MTITVHFTPEELEAYAYNFYASDEGKEQFTSWRRCITRSWLFLSVFVFRSLPTLQAMLWTVLSSVAVYLLLWLYRPIYVRGHVREYVNSYHQAPYTLHLTSDGIRYTEKLGSLLYSWNTVRGVEKEPREFLKLTILNSSLFIPPSAFLDLKHKEAFLKVLEDGRQGKKIPAWWTQDTP